MTDTSVKITVLLLTAAVGFVLGRLAVRAFGNVLLGGKMFGGNLL